MSIQHRTLDELRIAGLEALARELGAVGMVRFLQQFETGWGDYSVERHEWLDQADVQMLAERIRQRRQQIKDE
jgi:hypothetical protein